MPSLLFYFLLSRRKYPLYLYQPYYYVDSAVKMGVPVIFSIRIAQGVLAAVVLALSAYGMPSLFCSKSVANRE